MKPYSYKLILGSILLLLFTQWGCKDPTSFLDNKSINDLNEETVFSDSARTMDYLAGIYEGLYFWVNPTSSNSTNGPWDDVTDENSTRWPGGHNIPNQVFDGTFGTQFYDHNEALWSHFYTRIRQCNIFLKNVAADHSSLSVSLTKRTRAEIRFLRAYHYSLLMQGWGGVPLVGEVPFSLSDPNNVSRSTYSECVNYVVSELDDIAPKLPLGYSGIDYGRITRGACLALKSRVLLFAASPLYNGGNVAQSGELRELTAYPDSDPARWQKALNATQEVVNLGKYHLEMDNQTEPGYGFYRVFLERVNNEYILAYMDEPNKTAENNLLPSSRGGSYRRYPTQELVDAFPMENGLSIDDPASHYDPDNPYENRDPRFYYTVIYNGATYYDKGTNQMAPVWTYKGASPDGIKPVTSNKGTITGYYVRKMMDELVASNGTATTDRCLPVIRYAEILLNLAEAANETGNTSLAMKQLIEIRRRAGIEPGSDDRYGVPASPGQDEARTLIHRERFIELAFEGHRFWDIRRWKEGDRLDGQYIHGMQATKNGDNFDYERIETRHRYFKDNLYYFPIPPNEIAINHSLLQNPGW